jgi:YidC/Oxa1 family membrane protein insertase
MLSSLWNIALYKPLVNILAVLISAIPGGDVGLAIIILTILVKIVLYPLSQRAIVGQAKMNALAPLINNIKQGGASKEEQARQTFELYKKYKANPFSGCLLIFIQIPIIFALYYVFLNGLSFDAGTLYSFVNVPPHINTSFLGLIDIHGKSLLLALLAGISQYLQAHFMPKPHLSGDKNSFQDNFAKSMQTQMKYVFPFLVAFIAYKVSGAIALYWIASNLFAVGQQIYANKTKHLDVI